MSQPAFHLIQSDTLGEKILLVNGDFGLRSAADLYPECVAYTHTEVAKLMGLPEETLKTIHWVKKHFHGRVSLVTDPEQ